MVVTVMQSYAIIQTTGTRETIVNVAQAEHPLQAHWIPLPQGTARDWFRLDAASPWQPPEVMQAPGKYPARAITYKAFRARFSLAERIGLELAAMDSPAADIEQRTQSASVRVYMADAAAAEFIDLDDGDTRSGVQALEVAGLLSTGRSADILDSPVLDLERPTT